MSNPLEELLQKIEAAAKGIAGHYDDRVRAASADIRDAVTEAKLAFSDVEDAAEDLAGTKIPEPDPAVPAAPEAPSAPPSDDEGSAQEPVKSGPSAS